MEETCPKTRRGERQAVRIATRVLAIIIYTFAARLNDERSAMPAPYDETAITRVMLGCLTVNSSWLRGDITL